MNQIENHKPKTQAHIIGPNELKHFISSDTLLTM